MKRKLGFPLMLALAVIFSCQQKTDSDNPSDPTPDEAINEIEDKNPVKEDNSDNFISSTSKYSYEEEKDVKKSTGGTAGANKISILSIDGKLERCLEKDANVSTAAQIQCIGEAYTLWDDALNRYYQATKTAYGEKSQKALLTAQRNWMKFRDKELEFISTVYNNLGGTLYRIIANDDNMNLVKNRTLELAVMSMVGDNYDGKIYDYAASANNETYGSDKEYSACNSKDNSNLDMQDCATAYAKRSDKKLNEYYSKLRNILTDDEKEKLKTAQRNWLKFRDSELKIYDALYIDMDGGTIHATERVRKNGDMIYKRAVDLEAYYELLNELK